MARLLLPVRVVEPANAAALSSGSVCSSSGTYPQLSLLTFCPPRRRRIFTVAARILEVQDYPARRQKRHDQFQRQQDEDANFGDFQTFYEEDRGRASYPNRSFNGRSQSAQKSGEIGVYGGNGRSYTPWRSRRVSEGERMPGYAKSWRSHRVSERESVPAMPLSSQAKHPPMWNSHSKDKVRETFQSRSRQPFVSREDRRNISLSSGSEERQSKFTFREQDVAFREQDETGYAPLQRHDGQRAWQGAPRRSSENPLELNYEEKRGSVAWRQRKRYDAVAERERQMAHTAASTSGPNDTSWHSGENHRQFRREHGGHETEGLVQHSYLPTLRWNSSKERQEDGDEYIGTEVMIEGEQNERSGSEVSPITKIMDRLRSVEDRILTPQTRGHSGNKVADSLALPLAREYLSDRNPPDLFLDKSIPQLPTENSQQGAIDTRFPWEIENAKEEQDQIDDAMARRARPLSLAELTIPASELKRLRILSIHLKQRVKIGRHGVTTDLVNSIKERWRTCEVVKVKCEGPYAGNMKKTLETLEKKTGGLVIWKAGNVSVIYRGKDFGQPVSEIVDDLLAKKLGNLMSSEHQEALSEESNDEDEFEDENKVDESGELDVSQEDDASGQATSRKARGKGREYDQIEEYVKEMEDTLADLGPRYEDWTGAKPVPVDADLLPPFISNYSPPYRLLPFGVRPNISGSLATHLRRISRPLSPHFVIGRDRGLHGLAAAIVKLWEKSEIAKIGVKRGLLNTNQERIAEDIKQLTGGFLLCRDKQSITFYRGKDFLPHEVASALAERQAMVESLQEDEERGRADRSIKVQHNTGSSLATPSWVHILDPEEKVRLKKEAAKARRAQVVAHLEIKLKMAMRKKMKAGRELEKVEELLKPVGRSDDREGITDEERFMLKKIGLKMNAFLLVGRRGVFSGVVQNMHLHWKHRELVKIIIKEKDPVKLKETAEMLECESGGILISVEPTSKGHAIVVYRGKNYARPPQLRPPNLLTKRLALKRSMEMQRRESLSKHIQALEEEIVHLRAGLNKLSTERIESSQHHVLNDSDVHGLEKVDGNHTSPMESITVESRFSNKQHTTFSEEAFELSEDDEQLVISKLSKRKLRRLCEMGPVVRARRLSKIERHHLRDEVLSLSKAAQFLVGSSNPLSKIAASIRLYFLDHPFVKIGVKGRPGGTSVQDIAEELEELTGGAVYAQNDYKIILYRGWRRGENTPLEEIYDVLSPEQCDVLEEDDEDDEENALVDDLSINDNLVENEENYSDEELDEGENVEDEDFNDTMVENMENDSDEEGPDVEDDDLVERNNIEWDWLSDDSNSEEEDDFDDAHVKNMGNYLFKNGDEEGGGEGKDHMGNSNMKWGGLWNVADEDNEDAGRSLDSDFELDEDV